MKSLLFLSSAVCLAAAICDHGTSFFPRAEEHVPVATFGYDALDGPLNWYGLNTTTNGACSLGKNQSPINVITKNYKPVNGSSLNFNVDNYWDGAELLNLGSTLEVVANGTMTRDGKAFKLRQFHFHTPSEHRIDDEYYPMEVHFVFQADDHSVSVVGFPIEIAGDGFDLLESVFEHIGDVAKPGDRGHTGRLDFTRLERHLRRSSVYQYAGSLTTPPCTEGIAWNVVRDPIPTDVKTFLKVKKVMKFNSRYTQNHPGEINLLDHAKDVIISGA